MKQIYRGHEIEVGNTGTNPHLSTLTLKISDAQTRQIVEFRHLPDGAFRDSAGDILMDAKIAIDNYLEGESEFVKFVEHIRNWIDAYRDSAGLPAQDWAGHDGEVWRAAFDVGDGSLDCALATADEWLEANKQER